MTKKPMRIAIVVQRYGEEVNGGAELHARWLAEHLLPLAEMHVITTCAIDHVMWENAYAPGSTMLNGVHIHRFLVDSPQRSYRSTSGNHDLFSEFQRIKNQGPYSSTLLEFIEESYDYFDIFIFITYLFAPTRFGLMLVSDKAILVPTAHDEPPLYLPVFRSLFHLPRAIVYNTLPEKLLVNRITRNEKQVKEIIVGIGINVPQDVSESRFREKFKIEGDFVLYIGRIVQAKNVPELFDDFMRFRETYDKPLKLLLGGKSHLDIPAHPDIVHLGFLSEEEKFDAIRAARLIILPSLYESLSMIVLEAWLMKTAVLVNGRCEVLKYQCRQSNGGLYYTSYQEFEIGLTRLLNSPDLCQQLGQQGYQFASHHYNWDTIITKYKALFAEILHDEN